MAGNAPVRARATGRRLHNGAHAAPRTTRAALRRMSLCETLDRVLNKGAVIAGDLIISVADIDLLYVGLNVVLASTETMRQWDGARAKVAGGLGAAAHVVARPRP